MRPLPSSFAALAILALSVAVPRADTQAPSLEGYPAVGAAPTVKLLSPGAEPRTPLRYRVPAGYKDTMTMSTAMSMAMTIGEMAAPATELPVMTMTADVAVTGVAANGDITYDLAFTGMTADARPGVDPAVVSAMKASAAGITTIKGTITLSDRGVSRTAKLDAGKVGDPNLQQMVQSLSASLESMSMPLPEEAVGVGARWEVRQAFRSAGTALFQRGECELVSMGKGTVGLRVKFEQTAPRQTVANPALPPGATMEVEKITGSGAGALTLRLDSLIPAGELSSSSNALMSVEMGGQSQRMAIDTRMTVKVAPAK
jgi:hypothetical protein